MAKKYLAISEDRKHQVERDLIEDVSLISQDTTTARAYDTIDADARPQFVEIYEDLGVKYCKYTDQIIHGIVASSTLSGSTATIILPSVKVKGFSGLTPGKLYALVPITKEIVEWDEEDFSQLPIGLAASDTEIEFVDDWFKKRKQALPVPGELWCGVGVVVDGAEAVAGELWCGITVDGGGPTFDVLSLGDLEGPASSFSLTYSEVTDSNRRPIFTFYGRLNGDIVPSGEFIEWSINGINWYDCGMFPGGKHYTIYPDTLPLVLDFDTTYSLRIRYTSNTALVSNLVNATTAVEPEAAGADDYLTIWNFDGFSRIQENGRYNDAYEHGIRCLAPYDFFHPSFFNRTSGVYNLEELEWQIETLHQKGYKLLIHGRPTYAQPTAYDWDQSVRVHRRSGGGWTTITYSYRSTYHLGDAEWERDRNNAILGVNSNFDTKGSISYANATAVGRYLELMARISHLVNTGTCPDGTPYSDVVIGISLIDGGLNETGFNTQAFDPYTDGFYSDSTMAALRTFMQTKYGNIYALNSAWERNYASFAEINRGNVPKPNEGLDVNYNENQALRDIFDFRINHHAEFYQKVADAIHAPSTIVSGLSASTDIKFFAYVTENFTSGQGRTWGVLAMRKMYAPFDGLLSSTSSGGSPNYPTGSLSGGRTVHRDYAVRAALMRCILGNGNFGQEQDGDPVESNHGNSTSFEITKQYGGKYSVVALQVATDGEDPSHSWNRNVRSADGLTRTYRNDLKWMYETKMRGVTPPALPSLSSTLTYTDKDALAAPHNPNDILNTWMNAAQPNVYGIVNSLVGLDNTYTIGQVSLVIDSGSIEFTDVSIGGGSSKQILFWATVNGKTINNGFAFDWTTNGTNWFQGGKFPGWKLTTNVTSPSYLTSGMTVSLQIRLTGATSVLSNIITGITIP